MPLLTSPKLFSYIFLMVYYTAKLNSSGDEASLRFKLDKNFPLTGERNNVAFLNLQLKNYEILKSFCDESSNIFIFLQTYIYIYIYLFI